MQYCISGKNHYSDTVRLAVIADMVDRLDAGQITPGIASYSELYDTVVTAMEWDRLENELKSSIFQNPQQFIETDPEVACQLYNACAASSMALSSSPPPFSLARLASKTSKFIYQMR